jgi:two-component system, NarL family, sensor kinase
VTLGVVAGALLVNLNEQRKADSKLRAMAGQIVMSQEAERARVARELHDGVSQWLVSVKFVFETALERARRGQADPGVTQTLDAGVDRLREVLGEVRRISHDLRPALLDDLGLALALEHLVHEWSARSGIAAEVHCDVADRLPEAVATALYRVAQEALGNIERHAAAQQVQVRLEGRDGRLQFEIADDGVGFDTGRMLRAARAGLGLTHMRERIESLGGRFDLRSGAGGTVLVATFADDALAG